MQIRIIQAAALCTAWVLAPVVAKTDSGAITFARALQRTVAANPRLVAAERDIGIAVGRRVQAGARPNPEASFELDNALGSGPYRGARSAETTLQLSQLIELGGKRDARLAAGAAELDGAHWQLAAVRLELLSETAVAFYAVLTSQRRVGVYDAQIASLSQLTPLLQRRVEAGASSPGEVARAQVAIDLIRVERERALTALNIAKRELGVLMGVNVPDFARAVGDTSSIGRPPAFQTVLRAIDNNPQLVRWTAVRAQRDAELLSARLKPIPDVRLSAGWRHFRDSKDNAVRLGIAIPLPVWDRNQGGIIEAQEARAKVDAERGVNKTALILAVGRAYETIAGSSKEIELLRASAIPNARKAIEVIEGGYAQGRFSLLELLDAQSTALQAALRQEDALMNFHTAVATMEGLTGVPLTLARARAK